MASIISGMHPSIWDAGSQPELEECKTCCRKLFHCPLCPTFKPARKSKIRRHMNVHIKHALHFKDKTVCRCRLPCRAEGHYHCPFCQRTIIHRSDMEKHLTLCLGSSAALHALTSLTSAPPPVMTAPNFALPLALTSPTFSPSLAVTSPTSTSPLVVILPTSVPPPVAISPNSALPLVATSTTSPPPSVVIAPTSAPLPVVISPNSALPLVATSTTSAPSPVVIAPTSVPSPVVISPNSAPSPVGAPNSAPHPMVIAPTSKHPPDVILPMSKPHQAAREHSYALPHSAFGIVSVSKKVKCPHCTLTVYKRNLTIHIYRKHPDVSKDVTQASHLTSLCVDEKNGVFSVQRTSHGFSVPVHVQRKTWGEDHRIRCEVVECRQYRLVAHWSGLSHSLCEHIRSLDYCVNNASEVTLHKEVLEEMVSLEVIGNTNIDSCLKRQKTAQMSLVPLCVLIDFCGPPSQTWFSIHEPKMHSFCWLGRIFVTYNRKKNSWQCPCLKPWTSCPHISIAKWYLFQTQNDLLRTRVPPPSDST